ncbi:hypothetical protein [Flagellimonas halotolerans]|uniref:Uncharacterized protein n=1 Tax=Flagellimonas halotolerans TaxID=3112164 RepID=A0ABU6ITC7_9FLAO|nr:MULTISPECIES: hypothetical protein [unclassified Allomuricauda]MEC3966532.1 hypothetical protein [Muricauda sp. SYSU M86414]MEC4266331.1 hypothetical protein [Muricauda sp. SYSU M84420]
MKQILITIAIAGVLVSCKNTSENKKDADDSAVVETVENSTDQVETNYVPIDSDEALIAASLMAAPEASRDGCTIIGYNMAGDFVTLREGGNEFIVLADDPKKSGFNAACYHKSLEPFMARGRELRAEGKTGPEIFDIREEEAKSGKLDMGKPGSTLHIYYGESDLYNPKTNEVEGAQYRYVVYLPFATAESTGLPEKPVGPNHPWIMNPGTHRAHIMISPLPDKNKN